MRGTVRPSIFTDKNNNIQWVILDYIFKHSLQQ